MDRLASDRRSAFRTGSRLAAWPELRRKIEAVINDFRFDAQDHDLRLFCCSFSVPFPRAKRLQLIIFTLWLLLGRVLKIRHIQSMLLQEVIEIGPVLTRQLGCLAYISFAHL